MAKEMAAFELVEDVVGSGDGLVQQERLGSQLRLGDRSSGPRLRAMSLLSSAKGATGMDADKGGSVRRRSCSGTNNKRMLMEVNKVTKTKKKWKGNDRGRCRCSRSSHTKRRQISGQESAQGG